MNINRIPIAFYGKRRVTAPEITYKYNQKQILELQGIFGLPDYFRVDFANEGDTSTKAAIGTPDGVEVPDEYLLSGKAIKVYIVLNGPDESIQTVFEIDIPVRSRLPASDEIPTPEQRSVIDELIAALNDGVDRSEAAATNAENSETNAKDSENAAKGSENRAKESEDNAADSAKEARSYAKGGTGSRTGEDTDNAKYYMEQTGQTADTAIRNIRSETDVALNAIGQARTNGVSAVNQAGSTQIGNVNNAGSTQVQNIQREGTDQVGAVRNEGDTQVEAVEQAGDEQTSRAKSEAENSEAWAVGTRGGVPVPSTDPAYHNNAKYISEHIYVTLGVDDFFSVTSENPIQNKFLTPKIAIEGDDGKLYIVTKKVVNGFLVETFTEV